MRHRLACLMIAWLTGTLLASSLPAAGQLLNPDVPTVREGLEIGTSTSEIAITSDFRGADLTVFGALTNADELFLAIGQYDVVVTLEGPRDSATVRRKERVFGIWMNTASVTFDGVPESYSVASTRILEDIQGEALLNRIGVGIDHLDLSPVDYVGDALNVASFREAYRRLKLSNGLYQRDPAGVRFVSPSLFRATVKLPANVPDGVHLVHAYLFKSGELIMQKDLPLRVVKTGLEQAITDAAREKPVAYGLFCVLIAVMTGWGASIVFRKG
ncbi:TIGR02186 family protein [Rhizobium sp. SSA_523]|uniref:TIGR02186 family protein n=1 Tax=Rhizobium sp. SSA_523 TaxID=2952477 RepID=UPI0020911095|nr:TIGR02186 family protein [Rhizobium sp. SSA_523]MCO5732938.1 TIGR02186 family protein [Rhizobium sp. SSA_523]WKC23824.1 TIGR02186 family protein [Rhizobium sp. SSA_523]